MTKMMIANAYRPNALGSLDRTSCMLLRQYRFPYLYDPRDEHDMADHDRLMQQDYDRVSRCFQQHTHRGELGLESWVRAAFDEQVLAFLREVMQAKATTAWTGYRVMGSVHQGNGSPVWTFELFAKHPASNTEVYTGNIAPNVVIPSKGVHKYT